VNGPGNRDVEREMILAAAARLRAGILAVTFGLMGGVGLFAVTAWLLVKGGTPVGPHLGLLGNYFPGYRVSWPGAFLGGIYGAAAGAVVGWALATVYNRIADWRSRGSELPPGGSRC